LFQMSLRKKLILALGFGRLKRQVMRATNSAACPSHAAGGLSPELVSTTI
jgi:hypothetical protein